MVEYTADDHNGFNAVVKKIGHAHHPEVHHHSGGWNGNSAQNFGDNWYGNGGNWNNDNAGHHGAYSYSNLKQYTH